MDLARIEDVPTTGASAETAAQDNLTHCGVTASHKMAKTDLDRMQQYYPMIKRVGRRYNVEPDLIAGIISRESRAGKTLVDGWGDWDPRRGAWNGFGLMQVDVNPQGGGHQPRGAWDSEEHLNQATEILVHFIGCIQEKFRNWDPELQLKGGIAAYNMGDGNVRHGYDVDAFTTGKDYSNDVVARAQWFKKKRALPPPSPPPQPRRPQLVRHDSAECPLCDRELALACSVQ